MTLDATDAARRGVQNAVASYSDSAKVGPLILHICKVGSKAMPVSLGILDLVILETIKRTRYILDAANAARAGQEMVCLVTMAHPFFVAKARDALFSQASLSSPRI